jgi:hypothetical protein
MSFKNRSTIGNSYEFQAHQQRSQMLFFRECSTVIRGAPRHSQVCRWRSHVLCYATWPVAWATGSVLFSVRGYEVPSEPSEPSGTPACLRRKPGLSLIYMNSTEQLPQDHYGYIMAKWMVSYYGYIHGKMSVNGASTMFGLASWLLCVAIGRRDA